HRIRSPNGRNWRLLSRNQCCAQGGSGRFAGELTRGLFIHKISNYAEASRISSSMILMGAGRNFVAGFINNTLHLLKRKKEKVKREYEITEISVFHRFFRDGVCSAGAISKTTPIDQ